MSTSKLNPLLKKITFLSLIFIGIGIGQSQLKFAVIGDYGKAGSNELNVSLLVKSWNPDLIITLGDNNYENGEASTIDENIGQYYQEYIYPYLGTYGSGSPDSINHFFPSMGNHDWRASNAQPYLDYFTLPNNERYYDFVLGNVQFFMLDSDSNEPDGNTYSSTQGQWFTDRVSSSTAKWKVVGFHHPPYSSAQHGSSSFMQWPFRDLGIDAVFAAHDHSYERIIVDGLVYFVDGLGGKSKYNFGNPVPGSQVRYNDNYGAMLVETYSDSINFKFININSDLIDSYTIYSNPTNVDPEINISSYSLEQNYPNPFNPSTTIKYNIIEKGLVSIKIYNTLGSEVATLVEEVKPAGTYTANFNASNLSSGVYFYQLKAGKFVQTKKMLMLK